MISNSYPSFCDKLQNNGVLLVKRPNITDEAWRISGVCGWWPGWLERGKRCSVAAREMVRDTGEKRNPEGAEMRKRRKKKKAVKHKKKLWESLL